LSIFIVANVSGPTMSINLSLNTRAFVFYPMEKMVMRRAMAQISSCARFIFLSCTVVARESVVMNRESKHTETNEFNPHESPVESPVESAECGNADNLDAKNVRTIDALSAEVERYKDLYLRVRAELENYKKRLPREREEMYFQLILKVFKPLVVAVESLSVGVKNLDTSVNKEVEEGLQMSLRLFDACFKEISIDFIRPQDGVFDSRWHEAIATVHDTAVPDGNIVEVVRTGYRIGERVLRPAAVVVSKGAPPSEPSDSVH
jgi:molecular chaperone GrpE